MTNETTASQPKSIGDDALLPCPFCGSTNIDPAEWSGNEGASGPGCDDCGALADSAELWNRRAPAAQASATIQAAPRPTDDELWDATLRDRDAYHEWADKLADAISAHFGVGIGEHSNQNLPWAEALEAIESAATIQEPVMVAEPVAYADPMAFLNFTGGSATHEWMWAKPDAGLVPLYRAAPMVAGPAGVAGPWVVRERRDKETGKLLDCFVEAPKEGNMAYALEVLGDDYSGYGNVERKLEHCKLIVSSVNATLAATVKAVPSEAMEYLGADGKYLDTQGWSVENYDIGDTVTVPIHRNGKVIALVVAEYSEDFREVIGENCRLLTGAAPLADKAGGGE